MANLRGPSRAGSSRQIRRGCSAAGISLSPEPHLSCHQAAHSVLRSKILEVNFDLLGSRPVQRVTVEHRQQQLVKRTG